MITLLSEICERIYIQRWRAFCMLSLPYLTEPAQYLFHKLELMETKVILLFQEIGYLHEELFGAKVYPNLLYLCSWIHFAANKSRVQVPKLSLT